MQINPAWVEMVDEMNKRLIYVLKDAVECRCRPNIDDIDAQNILFYIEESDQLRARVVELEQSLRRIVSYYDLAKTGSSFPAMTMQAMAEHENTMFGEARKVLKNGR